MGLEAGIYYYEHLARAFSARGTPLKMVLVHADIQRAMGYMLDDERPQLAEYLLSLISQLADAGAEIAAIPAVTPHACIDMVAARSPIPLVSILEALAADVERRGLRRIALFGTKFVMQSNLYGALPPAIEVVRARPDEFERIDHLYRSYAVNANGGAAERVEFTEIANELCRRERLDAVILAGTDLSALFEGREPAFPYVDASQVHIDAIMRSL